MVVQVTLTWGHLYLGSSLPGVIFTWGHLYLGSSLPGVIFTWGHLCRRTGVSRAPSTSCCRVTCAINNLFLFIYSVVCVDVVRACWCGEGVYYVWCL